MNKRTALPSRQRLYKRIIYISVILAGMALLLVYQHMQQVSKEAEPATLVLLLPDNTNLHAPKVTVWLDAAREAGLPLKPMTDAEFMSSWFDRNQVAGVILPDQVHKVASDVLIDTINQYVTQGGHLMLVYDAGIWNLEQRYSEHASRLSGLAGIAYGDYQKLRAKTSTWSPVLASRATFEALQVPPAKYGTYASLRKLAKTPAITHDLINAPLYCLSSYRNPVLSYDSYVTSGKYQGEVLMQTVHGSVAAGIHRHGKGDVLFVNLPLAYLKSRTDGMLMQSFLRYFAVNMLHLPYLASEPDAVGGLVMNLHLGSNAALPALKKLRKLGIFRQGPFSIHITAGPDAHTIGDGLGIDVLHNKTTQHWIKFFQSRGDAIGSHGGWVHDYWGGHVPNKPTPEFENFLKLNKEALEKVTGQPDIEYSAPEGNHPAWVTDWLSKHGFIAYYFTGDSGMAPTRSYLNDRLVSPRLWSYPILTYHYMAGFEELRRGKVSPKQVTDWLRNISEFCVNNRTVRLIYFHPRGGLLYPEAVRSWLALTAKLQQTGKFRWYTMSGLSKFLNRRLQTHWRTSQSRATLTFRAENPQTLAGQVWLLEKTHYARPTVVAGKAHIDDSGRFWLVHAGDGRTLQFSTKREKAK
ncbi:MAG: polysaccharide deacetylase family protein [Gammaproteobacteria bacterium]